LGVEPPDSATENGFFSMAFTRACPSKRVAAAQLKGSSPSKMRISGLTIDDCP
jgi:hypothetical protein